MASTTQDLLQWFRERPRWLQDAARRLVQGCVLSNRDLDELMQICVVEAGGSVPPFAGLPEGAFDTQDPTQPVSLESISEVVGINRLSPRQPLNFGKTPLCAVYGRNGSGKSGYVRLLKHACGARHPGNLLGDVFTAGVQSASAKLTFSQDGAVQTVSWTGGAVPELQAIAIYDTACGLIYVNDENEVAFEPWLLRLFTQLTATCTALNKRLQDQAAQLTPSKPAFPVEYAATPAAGWYSQISARTTRKEIDETCAWPATSEQELLTIVSRLNEANPSAKAAIIRRQAASVLELATDLDDGYNDLADDRCTGHLEVRADAAAKRKASDEDAARVFAQAPLDGVGSKSWRLLWEAARQYSEQSAYKAAPFPNTSQGARCVLCQKVLDEETANRFVTFQEFVTGELQGLASAAEASLASSASSFFEIPTDALLVTKAEAAGIEDNSLRASMMAFAASLRARREALLKATAMDEVPALPDNQILATLRSLAEGLEKSAADCEEDAKGQNRPQLDQQRRELSARKWLHEQQKSIEEEVARNVAIGRLDAASALTNTSALSRHKSLLADELITSAYIDRFQKELGTLRASGLAVELKKTRAEVGRVYHRIVLKGACRDAKTMDVLSEGEFRVISLAAFIADTGGAGAKSTFVFDDPISSLDQVYEEEVARRLVELSTTRQVIVFTHRLSLLSELDRLGEKAGTKLTTVCLSDLRTGDICELPITLTKTKPAANRLLNERMKRVKVAMQKGGDEYRTEAKSLCTDIRILMERIVEADLLVGIVRRYSPEVQTKNKIQKLAKITPEHCRFVDDIMTKYSRYEHSQPEEAPSDLPKPKELEDDLRAILNFIEELGRR